MNNITLHAELIIQHHSDLTQFDDVKMSLNMACLNKRLREFVKGIFQTFAMKTLNKNITKLTQEQIEYFNTRISQNPIPKKLLTTYLMIHSTITNNVLIPIPQMITDKHVALELAKKLPIDQFIEKSKTLPHDLLSDIINELDEKTLIHAYYFCAYQKYQKNIFAPPNIADTIAHLITLLFQNREDFPLLQQMLAEPHFLYLNEMVYRDPQLWEIALQSHVFFTPKYSSYNRPIPSLLQKALFEHDDEKIYAIIHQFFTHPEMINTNIWTIEDKFGYFPIIYAVLMKDPVLIGLFCALGGSLDQEVQKGEQYGWTPLHFAMFNDSEIAQDLIEMGCDPLKENTQGVKPIHLQIQHLIKSGNTEKLQMIQKSNALDDLEILF